MLGWILETAESLGPERIVVVSAPDMEDVRALAAPHRTAIQDEPRGTGDALKAALPQLDGFAGRVLVLMGDEPFVDQAVLQEMIAASGPSLLGITPPDPAGLGRLVTGEGDTVSAIIEEKDAGEAQKAIGLCNAGVYCVDREKLAAWLDRLTPGETSGEYYLTDIVAFAHDEQTPFSLVTGEAPCGWGVNTRAELAAHEAHAQGMLREQAMTGGATLIDPGSVTLSWDTRIGQDVVIEPNVIIGPGVTIGGDVVIHAFSHIEGADIEAGVHIGPFARLRPGSHLHENVVIGNFIEVNRSTLMPGAKSKHVSYIGDALIGENTNIGAGTIIANYDGFKKHKTQIGRSVFVGSNSTIIPPITVGDEAILAAGSVITRDVKPGDLAISRSDQTEREGWAVEYRLRKSERLDKSKE